MATLRQKSVICADENSCRQRERWKKHGNLNVLFDQTTRFWKMFFIILIYTKHGSINLLQIYNWRCYLPAHVDVDDHSAIVSSTTSTTTILCSLFYLPIFYLRLHQCHRLEFNMLLCSSYCIIFLSFWHQGVKPFFVFRFSIFNINFPIFSQLFFFFQFSDI